jgi:hypothetical protein
VYDEAVKISAAGRAKCSSANFVRGVTNLGIWHLSFYRLVWTSPRVMTLKASRTQVLVSLLRREHITGVSSVLDTRYSSGVDRRLLSSRLDPYTSSQSWTEQYNINTQQRRPLTLGCAYCCRMSRALSRTSIQTDSCREAIKLCGCLDRVRQGPHNKRSRSRFDAYEIRHFPLGFPHLVSFSPKLAGVHAHMAWASCTVLCGREESAECWVNE